MNRMNLIRNQLSNSTQINTSIEVENVNGSNSAIKIVYLNSGLNALSKELVDNIYKTVIDLDRDEETKVIILTSKGKAFAAGADIKRLSRTDYKGMSHNSSFLMPLEYLSYNVTKPLIAAVNGIAYGGGFELALSCDMIFASDKAVFGFPELKLGLFPGAGGTQRLSKLMGVNKAMEFILTTRDIPLQELKQFGIINDIIPHDKLLTHTIKVAEQISKFSLLSVCAAKKAIRMSQETNLFGGLKTEKYLFDGLFNTQDKQIGIEAFLGKKTPKFVDK